MDIDLPEIEKKLPTQGLSRTNAKRKKDPNRAESRPSGYRPDIDSHRFDPKPITKDPPWQKQPDESYQAFEAFITYLTLDPSNRTVGRAAVQLGKSPATLANWSRRWSWRLRASAWEEHYLLLKLDALEVSKDEMFRGQQVVADIGVDLVKSQLSSLMKMMEAAQEADKNGAPMVIKGDTLVRMLDIATKIQRMAVIGRADAARETAERNARLSEAHAEEFVELIGELKSVLGLTAEQESLFDSVVQEHIT